MKRMSKYLIKSILIAILIFGICTIGAFAANYGSGEAYVGSEEYASIIDALDRAENGSTVTLNADVILYETYIVEEGRILTIDLNGHELTVEELNSTYAIANLGNLTLKDSRGGGLISSRGIYNGYDGEGVYDTNAQLTVQSGEYKCVASGGGAAIFNYATATVTGGKFTAKSSYAINNRKNMTITNSTVSSGIYCVGSLEITNTTVTNSRTNSNAIYASNSSVIINSGVFDNTVASSATVLSSNSRITINGGKFDIGSKAYLLDGAGIVINGGSFDGPIRSSGLVINGGSFVNNTDGVGFVAGDAVVYGGEFSGEELISYISARLAEGYAIDASGRVYLMSCATDEVAMIGSVKYATLAEAIEASRDGDVIKLLLDIEQESEIIIPKDKSIVIDLAGFEISHTHASSGDYSMITNYGSLTINDSSESGCGKISFTEVASDGVTALIGNRGGSLTVNGGELVAKSDSSSTVLVIDSHSEDGNAITTVNAGRLVSESFRSVRQYAASNEYKNDLVIIGGEFIGQVWVQSAVRGDALASITVTGGSFAPGGSDEAAIYIATLESLCIKAAVSGGTYSGSIAVDNTANISGFVIGGIFTEAAMNKTDESLLAENASFEKHEDGSYGIIIKDYKGVVLSGAKYNLTTSTSFVGNLYIRVPSADDGYTVYGYESIRVIGNDEYYVFTSSPEVSNITADIMFSITVEFDEDGERIITASFTTDSYFADVMNSYARIEEPTDDQIADMKLIMNATRYANELYKYINGASYSNYDAILSNYRYTPYITNVDDIDFSSKAEKNNESINDVVSSAGLKIHDSYYASFVFYVTEKYEDVKSVTVRYLSINEEICEHTLALKKSVLGENTVYYLEAGDVPIFDMLCIQVIVVEYADGRVESGAYNLAAYVNAQILNSTGAASLAKAIYAYAEASARFKLITE